MRKFGQKLQTGGCEKFLNLPQNQEKFSFFLHTPMDAVKTYSKVLTALYL